MRIGFFLSSEEYQPAQLLEQARLAEDAGFTGLWISDHYHPWNDEQGQSAFVWSMIGALSQQTTLPITTAVTCPTVRIHPAVIAHAAATSAVLTEGRFRLGVGSGEALNEHILGQHWPPAEVRLAMLEEAVDVLRRLWTGEVVDHRGRYYTVENARVYTLPDQPPPVYVSGFGPLATDLAARIGDGYVTTQPDAELVKRFRTGSGGKPTMAGAKGCWAPTREEAVDIAHRLWSTGGVPGELAQVLPTPQHFQQAAQLVTKEMTAEALPCGPDPEPYIEALRAYAEAGLDEVYVASIGPHYREFIRFYRDEVMPAFA